LSFAVELRLFGIPLRFNQSVSLILGFHGLCLPR
jgi:hypothetical protein